MQLFDVPLDPPLGDLIIQPFEAVAEKLDEMWEGKPD